MRILVVEDDARTASFIRRGLREERYTVDVACDGEEGLFMAQTGEYSLIILDHMLPKRSGLEVLRVLRAAGSSVAVLMLTAKGELKDRVVGLEAGADDYLPKPFGFAEFLARIHALLRRHTELLPANLRAGDLEIDVLRHEARRNGEVLALTSREYALLEFFLRHPNQVVTRTMLSEHVWEHDFDPLSNVIDVHIARLRQKINDARSEVLQTVRGTGYVLRAPDFSGERSKKSTRQAPGKIPVNAA